MDDATRGRIADAFSAEGVPVHRVGRPTTTLESLFLDVLAKDREDAGRRPS